MIGRVVWADSTRISGELVARVGLRMKNGERKNCYFKNVEPWGYVPVDADLPEREWIVDVECGYESIFDDELKKVTTTTPEKVNTNRNDNDVLVGYVDEHFEADIPFYRKIAMTDGISGYIELPETPLEDGDIEIYDFSDVDCDVDSDDIPPRIMMGDIEVAVSEEETFKETRDNASQPINVICCYDTYEQDYHVFFYDKFDGLNNPKQIREIVEEQFDDEEWTDSLNLDDIELYRSGTERELLVDFIDYMEERQFDLTSGWNWVDFDYQYLIDRIGSFDSLTADWLSPFEECKYRNNHKMLIRGLPAFDMLEAFDKMTFTNYRSMSLDYISREELGAGKIENVDINQTWEKNAEKLIGYNITDVALLVALDNSNDIHPFFYEISSICSIPIYDCMYEKRQIDGYVISRRGTDEILPTAEESEDIDNAGGYVSDPVNGLKENVGVTDLASLYPSAILSWNLSTETVSESPEQFDDYVKIPKVPEPKDVVGSIREEDIEMEWLYASMDEEGIIPRTAKKLFTKRNREKKKRDEFEEGTTEYEKWDRKQASTKVIQNSVYGVASSKYWRLSNQYLGDAVTSCARYALWKGKQTLDRLGYEHVYSDTDSHMFILTEDTPQEQVEELKEVSRIMDNDASEIATDIGLEGKHPFLHNFDSHGDEYACVLWEPEKVGSFLQLGKKKRYAQNLNWKEGNWYLDEPEISISGFEFRRSDSPEVTAELQQKVIKMILTGADFEKVSSYIRDIIDQIDEDHDEVRKFALPGSINKDLKDYPNRQVPGACIYSNEWLDYEFSEGDNPFVYLVKETPSDLPNTDVLALEWNEEVPDGFVLDKEAIIERAVRKPIVDIVGEMGWNFNEIRSGKKQKTQDMSTGGSNPFE